MSDAVTITSANFAAEVEQSDKPVILDFWAEWCGPCKAFLPTLAQFAAQHPQIKVCKVNVDDAPELGQRFSIMSIPTLVFFNKGKAVETAVGSMSLKDLTARATAAFKL